MLLELVSFVPFRNPNEYVTNKMVESIVANPYVHIQLLIYTTLNKISNWPLFKLIISDQTLITLK